jgi:hypothetical protein
MTAPAAESVAGMFCGRQESPRWDNRKRRRTEDARDGGTHVGIVTGSRLALPSALTNTRRELVSIFVTGHLRRFLAHVAGLGLIASAMLALPAACGSPTAPSEGSIVTLRVQDETFRVLLTTSEQVEAARAARAGGAARIPSGRIVAGTQVNSGWGWHLVDVVFVELAGHRTWNGRGRDTAEGDSVRGARR